MEFSKKDINKFSKEIAETDFNEDGTIKEAITLKLTDAEYKTIGYYDVVVEGNTKGFKSVPSHIRGEEPKERKDNCVEIEILDVDKFRLFLNDEIKGSNRVGALIGSRFVDNVELDNLKSILSKLDKESI